MNIKDRAQVILPPAILGRGAPGGFAFPLYFATEEGKLSDISKLMVDSNRAACS